MYSNLKKICVLSALSLVFVENGHSSQPPVDWKQQGGQQLGTVDKTQPPFRGTAKSKKGNKQLLQLQMTAQRRAAMGKSNSQDDKKEAK